MKKAVLLIASIAMFAASAVRAQDIVDVQGKNVDGRPGDRVFVELSYDYGDSFRVIAEDFQLRYPTEILNFVHADSTVLIRSSADVTAAGPGTLKSLPSYLLDLQFFAFFNSGAFLENDDAATGAYNLSFLVGNGSQERSGKVDMRLAFDIDDNAAPGEYPLSFDAISNLTQPGGVGFRYPSLPNLQVTVQAAVVPEPEVALMLLPGLLLVGLHARRRRARSKNAET